MQLRGNQLLRLSQHSPLAPSESIPSSGREFKDEMLRAIERSQEKVFYSNNFSTVSGQFKMNLGQSPIVERLSLSRDKLSRQDRRSPFLHSDIKYMQMMDRFVQGLGEKQTPEELSPHKMRVLKQLLEHYNVKNLNKQNYQSTKKFIAGLTSTFGLKIQSVKYEEAPKKMEYVYQKPATSSGSRVRSKQRNPGRVEPSLEVPPWKGFVEEPEDKYRSESREFQRTVRNNTSESKRRTTTFLLGSECDGFELRLRKFKQFLFLVNLSNEIYRDLELQSYEAPLKMYIGPGNNGNLIRSIMKKRFWFIETHNMKQACFVWTQIKVQSIFQRQERKPLEVVSRINKIQDIQKRKKEQVSPIKKKGARQFEPTDPLLKVLNKSQYADYKQLSGGFGYRRRQDFQYRLRFIKKRPTIIHDPPQYNLVHNHLPQNGLLGNKKAMFYSLRQYYRLNNRDVFATVPLTFHIQHGTRDQQFRKFLNIYNERARLKQPNIWIIKPGEFTNRGNGISCSSKIDQIRKTVSGCCTSKGQRKQRTFIIQSYLYKPLLYNKRKFDIRAYTLITVSNGILKGYWYQQGYIRTSSQYFDLDDLEDTMIHLTNDAVQKHGEEYGMFEPGNKLTYNDLQRYLDSSGCKVDFYSVVYPEMRRIATECVASTSLFLDAEKHQNNFEIFGLDFMIDEDFKVWLIEVNTNPCLQLSCGILERLIPQMVQNAFRIGLDPQFPPPNIFPQTRKYNISQNALLHNKFQLVFDELRDGYALSQLYSESSLMKNIGVVTEDKEEYADDGKMIDVVAD